MTTTIHLCLVRTRRRKSTVAKVTASSIAWKNQTNLNTSMSRYRIFIITSDSEKPQWVDLRFSQIQALFLEEPGVDMQANLETQNKWVLHRLHSQFRTVIRAHKVIIQSCWTRSIRWKQSHLHQALFSDLPPHKTETEQLLSPKLQRKTHSMGISATGQQIHMGITVQGSQPGSNSHKWCRAK